jgi:hypothetical protein
VSNRPCTAIAMIATKPTARRMPRIVEKRPQTAGRSMPYLYYPLPVGFIPGAGVTKASPASIHEQFNAPVPLFPADPA